MSRERDGVSRRGGTVDPRLEARLAIEDDPPLAPLRVAWFTRGNPARSARLRDLVTIGDARNKASLVPRDW